jgi:hypothetical protein
LDKPKYEGVPVYMDGKEWVIPALSVRQYREHQKLLQDGDVTQENLHDYIVARVPLIGAAMRRNYPELTDEQVMDMLDLRTVVRVIQAIGFQTGLRPAQPGE